MNDNPSAILFLGENRHTLVLRGDGTVDAVVCDPPYGLGKEPDMVEVLRHWLAGDDYEATGGGFMGKTWDSFVPGPATWREVFRVLKPGGHLLAFAGSRTFDMMGLAIRLAGFEIRDTVSWLYGSGFPKSLDVSKAIDKAGGTSPAEQARVLRFARERSGLSVEDVVDAVGCTAASVHNWEHGRARAAGEAVEHVTPSPEYRARLADLLGYTADERRVVGVGGGSRGLYETGHRGIAYADAPATPAAEQWQGWGTALKPAWEPVIVARRPLAGTVAANVLAHGTGAINVDGCRIGLAEGETGWAAGGEKVTDNNVFGHGLGVGNGTHDAGRWPANVALDEAAAAMLDEATGTLASSAPHKTKRSADADTRGRTGYGTFAGQEDVVIGYGDKGGASRFMYVAKPGKAERNAGVDPALGAHPTVKPVALMRWLVRLVTPPGGIVLDPFLGSGTTGIAALAEGFDFVGCELGPDYMAIAEARIRHHHPDSAVTTLDLSPAAVT